MAETLVYSNPLDPYHLLLLGRAKYELYEFLFDEIKTQQDNEILTRLIAECEHTLLASVDLQNDSKLDVVPNLITSLEIFYNYFQTFYKRSNDNKC